MRVLIVEDEAPAARRLQRLVSAELVVENIEIVIVDNLENASEFLAKYVVDLLLLDLELFGHDGFEILNTVKKERPATIIVSANVDRALEAFDHDVVDFVSKPVSAERLRRALKRASELKAESMRLTIRSLGRVDIVDVSHIVHLSGAGDYVEITTIDDQRLLHSERLDVLEKTLPITFVRTHRSYIVNMTYVSQLLVVDRNQQVVVTCKAEHIPISRRRLQAVKKQFLQKPMVTNAR